MKSFGCSALTTSLSFCCQKKSAILIPPWVSFEDVILFFSMGSHLWYFRTLPSSDMRFSLQPLIWWSSGSHIHIYIYIFFYSFAESFEFWEFKFKWVCVFPIWLAILVLGLYLLYSYAARTVKSSLELSKSLILASNWVSAGFTHFSGLMFAAGFWSLCSCYFLGQWYIYKYMFSMP